MTSRSLLRARGGAALAALAVAATAAPALAVPRADRELRKAERQARQVQSKARAAKPAAPVRTGRGKDSAASAPALGKGKGKGKGKPLPVEIPAVPKVTLPSVSPVANPAPTAAAAPPAAAAAPTSASPSPTARRERRAARRAARRVSAAKPGAIHAEPAPGSHTARPRGRTCRGARRRRRERRRTQQARPAKKESDSPVAPVTRTVSDIVEVVPEPVKMLLAAMGILSVVLGGGYLFTSARARRLSRQRSDLLQEVGLLQTALLPPVPETVGAVRTSVAYRPSDGPGAGGDFYDAMTLPGGRAAFILGDVSGHGRAALARTAFMRYTLRAYLEAGLDPRTTLQVAGRVVDEHLGGDFATVVLAVHDPSSGSLTYACAGHPAPIVVGPSRHEPVLAAGSPPIGLGLRTGLRQTTLPLPPGSVVCLYTDGLAEARTARGILGRPRLGDIVGSLGRGATAHELLDEVAREARLVTDDMATVVLTPTAGVTAGGFRSEQLEVSSEDASDDLVRKFLAACGVAAVDSGPLVAEVHELVEVHGGAVVHVGYGISKPRVEVLPRNVESIEAASRRLVRATG